MTQVKVTGKQINEFAAQNNNLPNYWQCTTVWNDKQRKWERLNGANVSAKYKAILQLIQETKAAVTITPESILIEYKQGQSKISRDILTDNFLLPLINCNYGFSNVITN